MPLYKRISVHSDIEVLIWKIEELEEQLAKGVTLNDGEIEKLGRISHPKKRAEFLALRQCLVAYFGENPEVIYLENGKPLLQNEHKISFSHTQGFAGMAISEKHELGIDLEMYRPGIKRIASKFLRQAEKETIRPETAVEHITHYWGVKEAMVKITGNRRLNFKKQILVEPFFYPTKNKAKGEILKGNENLKVEAVFEKFEKLHLTVGWAT